VPCFLCTLRTLRLLRDLVNDLARAAILGDR
jgi:hypothetical protein